jgi:hypothetical protein
MSKKKRDQQRDNVRRERLERHSTEDLLAALDPLTPIDQRKVHPFGDKTLIRQILAGRGVRS